MAGLDDVLERLVNDPRFRQLLADDPATALAGYQLSADDLEVVATTVAEAPAGAGGLESRQSKSALFSLFSQVADVVGQPSSGRGGSSLPVASRGGSAAGADDVPFNPQPEPPAPSDLAGSTAPGADVMFNPQPDPPMPSDLAGSTTPGADVMFNPQPDPPAPGGITFDGDGRMPGGAEDVMFNPQPDPPAPGGVAFDGDGKHTGGATGG
jgi:hypothetical protein